ncbi:amino acid ABC transporter substrate-binding protein [Pasteurellaceae bacterium RH1A]|nr:amino acid ABC transporter substrate-binding protein [Pasteurellaceae bacterium RH1A]
MKKALLSKLFLSAGLALTALTVHAGPISDRVEQTKTLLVGTEGTYAPFTFHDKEGKLTGYDIEVIQAVGDKLGLKVEFKETQWDAMFAGLNAKRFDVIANQVGATEERKKKYSFSLPYNLSRAVIVTRADNDKIKSFADLKGVKSAQSLTSNYTALARENGAVLVTVDSLAQNLELVKQGRVETTVNDQIAVLDYFKQHPNAGLKIAVKADESVGSHFTFLQGEDELIAKFDKALQELQAEGTLSQLSIKWFGDDVTK